MLSFSVTVSHPILSYIDIVTRSVCQVTYCIMWKKGYIYKDRRTREDYISLIFLMKEAELYDQSNFDKVFFIPWRFVLQKDYMKLAFCFKPRINLANSNSKHDSKFMTSFRRTQNWKWTNSAHWLTESRWQHLT